MERRSFMHLLLGSTIIPEFDALRDFQDNPRNLWRSVRKMFPDASSEWLNFNNGSAGMVSKVVMKAFQENLEKMNQEPPYQYLLSFQDYLNETKNGLASLIGASGKNISLTRNTTEAINYISQGLVLKNGGQILTANHDYPQALNSLEKAAQRNNNKLKTIQLNFQESEEEIIRTYESHLKENTSVLLITAQTHREGQIMPVKKLVNLAKKYNALTLVDAAHAYGQYPHSVTDWDCDFYCTSLHKWFGAPHGSGILYIKEGMVETIKGPDSCPDPFSAEMNKFTYLGTRSFAQEVSIGTALDLMNNIGLENKFKRHKEMTEYWTKSFVDNEIIDIIKPEKFGAVAAFNINVKAKPFKEHLKNNKVYLKTVRAAKAKKTSFRVSPGIYHNFKDLDRFIDVIKSFQ